MKSFFHFVVLFGAFLISAPFSVCAKEVHEDVAVTTSERLSLAKSFVERLKAGLERADRVLSQSDSRVNENILEDGEILLLQPVLPKRFVIDGVILGRVHNRKILISMADLSSVLNIPLSVDAEEGVVEGWYIRENKQFSLNVGNKTAVTDHGSYTISDDVLIEDGDIFVPITELGTWMNFDIDPKISSQQLYITSEVPLPIQEKYARRKDGQVRKGPAEPTLPRAQDDYKSFSAPSVDVSTRSTYRKTGGSKEGVDSHSIAVRTSGDVAYGTLTTQSQYDNTDNLKSLRMNYKKETLEPELLGPLKARRFEVGDVSTTNVPLGGSVSQELGFRVTNTDALRTFSTPFTAISGTAFPGWDVELYRNNQLVGFREVGDDGFYSFNNVNLFLSNNNFKLVFYGPQGEVREESVSIPVNSSTLARGVESVYDVSVSLDQKNTYNNRDSFASNDDEGSLNVAAFYEKPILPGLSVSAGLRSSESDDTRNTVVNAGASATVLQALINSGIAVDDEGDMAAELIVRRDFDQHEMSNSLNWRGTNFDTESGEAEIGTLGNTLTVNGPLPMGIGTRPRYSMNVSYSGDTEGDYTLNSSAGFNTAFNRITVNEQVTHTTGSNIPDDSIASFTNIVGSYGRNRMRVGVDYLIKPDSELRNVLATYRRDISNKMDFELGVTKRYQTDLTEYSAKLDWQAGFVRISPSVTYNSDQDIFAGVNTRFGLVRDSERERTNMYDHNVTNSGNVSAFVYLDKDGNGEFDGEDEPLEGVLVKAPQNGGSRKTDEDGFATFTRMGRLRLTDVFVDPESLQDPAWVTGFDGVSVLPREGNTVSIAFPVHMSGEIDGSVFIRPVSLPGAEADAAPKPIAMRNIELNLYNVEGDVEKTVVTDSTGFYYIDRVPPGRYLLIVEQKSAENGRFIRPEPQQIEIGYEGTVLYGNNIFVEPGEGDVPSSFLTDYDDYKERHPHIDFSDEYDLVLNLGNYNSRLLMSVVWYKIRSRYQAIIQGSKLFVPPTESYASIKTGKHALRVGLKNATLEQAYNRCRALIARDQYCEVEIYPSYMKQAKSEL